MTRRFYNPPNLGLGRVVWDPKGQRTLVEFIDNQCYVDKDSVAEKLLELGYLEVPMDSEAPPYVPDPPVVDVNVKVLPKGANEEWELAKQKREALLAQKVPPTPEKKKEVPNKKSSAPKPKSSPSTAKKKAAKAMAKTKVAKTKKKKRKPIL